MKDEIQNTSIYIHSLNEQPDGRFTLVFNRDGKNMMQSNLAVSCNGIEHHDDGMTYMNITFECVEKFNESVVI